MFGKIKLIVATRSGVGIILEYSLSSRFNSQIHKLCVKIPCSDPDRTFEDFARRMKAWAPRDFSAYLVDQQELDWLLLLGWSLGKCPQAGRNVTCALFGDFQSFFGFVSIRNWSKNQSLKPCRVAQHLWNSISGQTLTDFKDS